jgi:hypothetical protein
VLGGPCRLFLEQLLRTLPYLVVLALTIAGVAFTSITHTPLIRYWELLAAATGIICVTTGWSDRDKEAVLN